MSQTYASGHVSGNKGDAIGGVIGDDNGASFTNAYWDTTTTGIGKASQGAGNVKNAPGIAGLSNAQLTSGLPTGFDPATWAEHSGTNSGLPYLIDLPPPG